MKIVMKSYMTGADYAYGPGDVAEFSDADAAFIVSVGGARHLTDAEKAALPPPPAAKPVLTLKKAEKS